MKNIRIYVHIPFCESKCAYCAFASFVVQKSVQEKYFEKLGEEISTCKFCNARVKSVYFGGGTPSCVEQKYIEKIMSLLRQKFVFDKDAEITIECNPSSADEKKLEKYRKMGFNRVSFGVQSLDDKTLKFLGRRHNSVGALKSIDEAKRAGFENISADLLIGVNFDEQRVAADAIKLVERGVKHISAYMLQIEEHTPLYGLVQKDRSILPDDDKCVKMYENLNSALKKRGFERYEISNFALEGYQSEHNLGYWRGDEYIGFGVAAHSFVGGVRKANADNIEDYFCKKGGYREKLTSTQKITELIMLGLRCKLGFSIKKLKKYGYNIEENEDFQRLLDGGYIFRDKGDSDRVRLNEKYYGVSNSIIIKLLPK